MNQEMGAADLFRAAARLVERALIKLDVKEHACVACGTRLFENRDHAKIYEQFTDTPLKLTSAAERLDGRTESAPSRRHRRQ